MLIIYLVDYKRYWEFCQHDEYCNEGLPNNLCGSMINFFVCIAGLSLMGTNVHKYIVNYQLSVDVYSLTPYHKFFIYQFKCLIHFEQCNNCQLTMLHCKNNTDWLILKKHRQIIMTLFTDDKRSCKSTLKSILKYKFSGQMRKSGNSNTNFL